VTEAGSIDDLIRARGNAGSERDPEDDRLHEMRQRVSSEEGIADWWEECRGGNERQIRESALTIRARLGLPDMSPSFESAMAAQRRAQAERNARMNH
jgi:hypothetical protein